MLSLVTFVALAASTLLGTALADVEKRAPGNWQLHPFGDTFDRVRSSVILTYDSY